MFTMCRVLVASVLFMLLSGPVVYAWSLQQLTMKSMDKVRQRQQELELEDAASLLSVMSTSFESGPGTDTTEVDGMASEIMDKPAEGEVRQRHQRERDGRRDDGESTGIDISSSTIPASAFRRLSSSAPSKSRHNHGAASKAEEDSSGDSADVATENENEQGQFVSGLEAFMEEIEINPILNPLDFLQSGDEGMLLPLKARQLKRDWCLGAVFEQEIKHDGCKSVFVKNKLCYGQCGSFFVPRAKHGHFESCSYCTPVRSRVEIISLTCPGRANRVKKVEIVESCGCRPCGHRYI
ncbi:gremlin292 precursor [Saccoglossus kowalevskii]|uniref:Gremlin292 n=1 Tax=Saccoglossus kowalevskii TaxID=10224 RepID=D2XMT5_SACKO|nr:gremlin292 precursor [Saccoglossus kowalevskii]ADB22422.1 gremlin292 [Saccoglossus kowalevskii]